MFLSSVEIEFIIKDGDVMYSICSYVAETDEAIDLVEGEKVYIIGSYKTKILSTNFLL